MKPKIGSYFSKDDIEALSQEEWATVREEFRKMGYRVSDYYGLRRQAPVCSTIVALDDDGDLVWKGDYGKRGFQLYPKDFLPKPAAAFEAVKFRTDHDEDRLRVAVAHLQSLGYTMDDATALKRLMSNASIFIGVVGSRQGTINFFQLKSTFNAVDAQEYNFGVLVERTVTIKGIEPVPIYVDVQGVKCEVKALSAFLQSQKSANQSA